MKYFVFIMTLLSVSSFAAHATDFAAPIRLVFDSTLSGAQPAVAAEPGKGFVISWQETEGDKSTLHWLTTDSKGLKTGRGVVASGSNWFVNWADTPSITVLDNGDWVAFWLQRVSVDSPKGYHIHLVRSEDRGETWSAPITPHSDKTATQHGFVSMIPDGDDRVLVAWLDDRLSAAPVDDAGAHSEHDHSSSAMTLRSAVVTRGGNILEETIIDDRTCSCCQTDMIRVNSQSVIVYRDRTHNEIRDISISNRVGSLWGKPEAVNNDGWVIDGCPVNGPTLSTNGEKLLVFWPTMVDETIQLRAQLRDISKREAIIKTHFLDLPMVPSGRVDSAEWGNGFLVTWISRARERPAVEYAIIDADGGITLGSPISQPELRGRATGFPKIASDGLTALVVWPESENGKPVIGAALFRSPLHSVLSHSQ